MENWFYTPFFVDLKQWPPCSSPARTSEFNPLSHFPSKLFPYIYCMKYMYTLLVALVIATGISAQTDSNWVTIAINHTATIDFPGKPKRVEASGQSVLTLLNQNHVFTALVAKSNLGLSPDSVAVSQFYESYLKGMMYSIPGIKLLDESDVDVRGVTGKEYYMHGNVKGVEVWVTSRAFLSSGELYSCVFITYNEGEQSSPDKGRFFASFRTDGIPTGAAEPVAAKSKFDFEQYLPQVEIFGAVTGGIFVFILLAVLVQYLFKRKRTTQQGPPVG
jgi:hypothetical protein